MSIELPDAAVSNQPHATLLRYFAVERRFAKVQLKVSMEGLMPALKGSMESPLLASRSIKNGGPCANTVVAYGSTMSKPLSKPALASAFAVNMLQKSDWLSCGWAVGDVLRDGRDK